MKVKNRVLVTGIGVISPFGIGRAILWDSLIGGKDGVDEIKSFDTSKYRTSRAGQIKNVDWEQYIDNENLPHFGPTSRLVVATAHLAFNDAGINPNDIVNKEIGVCIGSTVAEYNIVKNITILEIEKGFRAVPPELIKKEPINNIPNSIFREFCCRGISLSFSTACAAGNYAIGYAYDLIRDSEVDIVVAGGVDVFSEETFAGFNRLFAVAPDKCQPFSKNRKGMILSEGSGILILESESCARERNAVIYGEILGYGLSCDAYHPTNPHPEGEGIANAYKNLFQKTNINVKDVDYINAHGTGTKANDKAETKAIKTFFGDRAKHIPVSSIKSMIGHSMGASSAIEAISCCLTAQTGLIPPTINYEEKDPDCDLDYVPNVCRRKEVQLAISNSFGFGGNNSVLAIGKYYE